MMANEKITETEREVPESAVPLAIRRRVQARESAYLADLKAEAEAGNTKKIIELGEAYEQGLYDVEPDTDNAYEYYAEAWIYGDDSLIQKKYADGSYGDILKLCQMARHSRVRGKLKLRDIEQVEVEICLTVVNARLNSGEIAASFDFIDTFATQIPENKQLAGLEQKIFNDYTEQRSGRGEFGRALEMCHIARERGSLALALITDTEIKICHTKIEKVMKAHKFPEAFKLLDGFKETIPENEKIPALEGELFADYVNNNLVAAKNYDEILTLCQLARGRKVVDEATIAAAEMNVCTRKVQICLNENGHRMALLLLYKYVRELPSGSGLLALELQLFADWVKNSAGKQKMNVCAAILQKKWPENAEQIEKTYSGELTRTVEDYNEARHQEAKSARLARADNAARNLILAPGVLLAFMLGLGAWTDNYSAAESIGVAVATILVWRFALMMILKPVVRTVFCYPALTAVTCAALSAGGFAAAAIYEPWTFAPGLALGVAIYYFMHGSLALHYEQLEAQKIRESAPFMALDIPR